jgi:hypothetical protein
MLVDEELVVRSADRVIEDRPVKADIDVGYPQQSTV